ncbi:uncharacterized protein BDR25DRAFT_352675 [Lindgomyces ingoldianus]|uniref:Uncharacterized protein n=1 Tax=Lindgomyces ingoldianus TaxID=673940 RepID=A0ACB6R2B1_9PLEO|nr:uncharacterized protein BDR25DRAFT_352675 [Lindgomyces ingoldianus]KAF2473235.1 hypothetical protein BDR25DRAFT_352675 [Lindgomyces ingoldianus]
MGKLLGNGPFIHRDIGVLGRISKEVFIGYDYSCLTQRLAKSHALIHNTGLHFHHFSVLDFVVFESEDLVYEFIIGHNQPLTPENVGAYQDEMSGETGIHHLTQWLISWEQEHEQSLASWDRRENKEKERRNIESLLHVGNIGTVERPPFMIMDIMTQWWSKTRTKKTTQALFPSVLRQPCATIYASDGTIYGERANFIKHETELRCYTAAPALKIPDPSIESPIRAHDFFVRRSERSRIKIDESNIPFTAIEVSNEGTHIHSILNPHFLTPHNQSVQFAEGV